MARASYDLVGLVDIAEMCGVAKNSAWRWSKRTGFPEPVGRVSGRVPVWRRADVERWAKANLPLVEGRPKKS
jgi:predicted DNA-binding transcriptional regulator AlpA